MKYRHVAHRLVVGEVKYSKREQAKTLYVVPRFSAVSLKHIARNVKCVHGDVLHEPFPNIFDCLTSQHTLGQQELFEFAVVPQHQHYFFEVFAR
jgi:hypothetical protein